MKNIKKLLLATTTSLLLSGILAGCGGTNGSSPETKPSSDAPAQVSSELEPEKSEQEPGKSEASPEKSEQEPAHSEQEPAESVEPPVSLEPVVTATGISITHAPNKTHYLAGDTFNPDGMVVTVTYDDQSTEDLSADEYTIDKEEALQVTDTEITVTWGDFTATTPIVVNIFKHEYNCTETVEDEVYTFASTPTKWAAFKMLPQEAMEDLTNAVIAFDIKVDSILNDTLYFAGILPESQKISHDFSLGGGSSEFVFEEEAGDDGFYHLEFEYDSIFASAIDENGASSVQYLRVGFVDDNYQAENDMVEGIIQIKNVEVYDSLAAPTIALDEATISWTAVEGADRYDIYENKVKVADTTDLTYAIDKDEDGVYKYSVVAVDTDGEIAHSAFSNFVEFIRAENDPDDGANVTNPITSVTWNVAGKEGRFVGENAANGTRITYTDVPDNDYYGGADSSSLADLGIEGITYFELAIVNYDAHTAKMAVNVRDGEKKSINIASDENKVIHGEGSSFERISSGGGAYFYLAGLTTTVVRFAINTAKTPSMIRLMFDCFQNKGETYSGQVVIKGFGSNVVLPE